MAQIFVVLMVLIMTVFSSISSCGVTVAESGTAPQPSPTVTAAASARI